jgi:hypothetical protein
VAPQHERYRSHRAVRLLLEVLAHPMPLVLVLDDFHWADSGSVELLGALLRRAPAAAVLVVVALRPRQVRQRLGAVVGVWDSAEDVARIAPALEPARQRLWAQLGTNPPLEVFEVADQLR